MNKYRALFAFLLAGQICMMQAAENDSMAENGAKNSQNLKYYLCSEYDDEEKCDRHTIKLYDETADALVGDIEYLTYADGQAPYINSLYVNGAEQGKGHGTRLFLAAMHRIKKSNYKKVSWRALPLSRVSFYEQFGARLIEETDIEKKMGSALPFILTARRNGDMEFDFERDGNPRKNLKKFRSRKKLEEVKEVLSASSHTSSTIDTVKQQ